MINKQSLIVLLLLCASFMGFGQSLTAGDIAFLQYNGTGSGTNIKFLALKDIPNGEVIYFTDNGWLNTNNFRGGEGLVTWTSPGVNCGDVITFSEGSMALSTNGDQILAYQGSVVSPTFITAINMDGTGWAVTATSPNDSALPIGLTNGTDALSISPEVDNAIYNGTLSGTKASIRAAINNWTNWTTINTNVLNFTGTFTLSDCGGCIPPSDPSGTISSAQNCGSTDLSFSINSTNLYWQTSATGTDTTNNTTTSFNVTSPGTYYVRAFDGACWSSGTVSQAISIVNPINISIQPSDQSSTVGNTATFSVSASNAVSYQWQIDTGSGWNNVSTGTGGTTNSYITPATTLAMDNYQYQVVIAGTSPCSSVTSETATLTVSNGPCIDEAFDAGTIAPSGWAFTSIEGTYTSAGNFGNSSPSLRMDDTNDRIETSTISGASELSFWLKGQSTDAASALLIEGFNGSLWVTIDNITNSIPTTGTTYVYNSATSPALPANIEKFRFTYTKGVGNLAFDDVLVICGSGSPGSCAFSDLILTEIYDAVTGSLGYIEIFNGTGQTIDLTNYSIRRYADNTDFSNNYYTLYTFPSSVTSISNNQVLFGKVFSPSEPTDTASPDFSFVIDCSNTGGNFNCGGINGDDIFHLYNGTTLIDVYIVPNNGTGYSGKRNLSTSGPNTTSNPADWTYYSTEETSDLGNFPFVVNVTTWDSGAWSPTAPDINTIAIINDDYDTNTNGSFSACSLIINDGAAINIADGYYVEVQNDLTVNGNIIVQAQGAFVQHNDDGIVDGNVLSDKTKIVVNKKTARSNAWYEYTYWSSPVVGETIGDGLFESTTNRRFKFNAQNFLDHCAETNNNNICDDNGSLGLQDGIDDDNNDWQWVNGATVMQRGVGYASTHNSTIFGSTPGCPGPTCSIEYTFEGPFNNGQIPVFVYRNDSELNDTNNNFIGNPYPSAIDVDEFFDLNVYNATTNLNGTLEGAIYLWSQNMDPSSTANGNQNLNFSDLDYAIINAGTGETAGGDGLIPERYIPSGQGFFVNYSNDGATVAVNGDIKTGEVIFNNSMRIADGTSNSQFFRTSSGPLKTKKAFNKIWVNLTSDNGVFSQILVGYIDGATNSFDGAYFDAPRNLSQKTASALYSTIPENQSKYAIQGKDPNSLSLDEVIPLGFYTAITGATLYKLSIAQIEGDFLTSNTIYLKDNLLNKVYDLTASDYSFTSEVGEFKDRFEIVFQSESLSDIEAQLNLNKLTIIELNDGRVQLKTNTNLTIKSVQILDMLGRTLYQLKGTSTTEIYNLNTLSQAAYIAKVELSNGQIITKKAVKRN